MNKYIKEVGEIAGINNVFLEDEFLLQGYNIMAILNKSFKYIKEMKLFGFYGQAAPLGNNYVVNSFLFDRKKYEAYLQPLIDGLD